MLPGMRNHILAAVLAAGVVLGFVAGARAGDREKDKERMQQLWKELERCNNERDGDKVVAVFSKESFKNNERIVKLALDGTKEQVKAAGPHTRVEVFRIRMLAKRADVEKLNGRGYVRWATSQGWYVTPADERTAQTLDDFRFNAAGTEATARLVEDGDPTEIRLRFVKEEAGWKYDEAHSYGEYDRVLRKIAKEEKMTEDDVVEEVLETETGKKVPESVWNPMGK
jgi:hypothetical protein